jgi:hypothetical protein
VVVVGGMGSLSGAFLASILIGSIQTLLWPWTADDVLLGHFTTYPESFTTAARSPFRRWHPSCHFFCSSGTDSDFSGPRVFGYAEG